MSEKNIHHLNDTTLKYLSMAQSKCQHQYLGLPGGEYKTSLPQEIVFPNMVFGRADEYYTTEKGLIINLEEESGHITDEIKNKLSKYVIFASYRYLRKVYLAVICHKDPKKENEIHEYSPSVYIKINYIYLTQDMLWRDYENLIKKVKQKEELTDKEALDIAFVSKFISKEYASQIVESLTEVYNDSIIKDEILRWDVGVILGGMVLKHIKNKAKQNKLLERIDMRHIESEIEKIVYDKYGNLLDAKDKEIEATGKELEATGKKLEVTGKELKEYKNVVNQLKEIKDLSPEVKQIINSIP